MAITQNIVLVPYFFLNENDPLTLMFNPLTCGDRVISVSLGQYHGCWCPGSLRRQGISSNDIDCIEYVGPSLTWERISGTCVMSMWSNDTKCKYMLPFSLKKLARKELKYAHLRFLHRAQWWEDTSFLHRSLLPSDCEPTFYRGRPLAVGCPSRISERKWPLQSERQSVVKKNTYQ